MYSLNGIPFKKKKFRTAGRTDTRTDIRTDKRTDGRSDYIMPQILFWGIKTGAKLTPYTVISGCNDIQGTGMNIVTCDYRYIRSYCS